MRRKFFAKLQRSVVLFAAMGIFAVCSIVSVFSMSSMFELLHTEQTQKLLVTTGIKANTISQYVAHIKDVAMQITSRTVARQKLEAYNYGKIPLGELRVFSRNILKDALNMSSAVTGITRLDQRGQLVAQVGHVIPQDYWLVPGADIRNAVITDPVQLQGKYYLIGAAPIANSKGERLGTDIIMFDGADLVHIVDESAGYKQTTNSTLGIFENNRFNALLPSDSNSQPLAKIADAMKNRADGPRILQTGDLWNSQPVIAYAGVQKTQWVLLLTVDAADIYAPVRTKILWLGGVIMMLVLAGTVSTFLLFRFLSAKVRRSLELEHLVQQQTEALAEKEAHLRNILDTIPYGVQENDTAGVVTYANPAHHKLNGFPAGKLVGKAIWHNLTNEEEKLYLQDYLKFLVREQPIPTPYVTKNRTNDGHVIDVQVDWNYKRDAQGKITGFISIVTDTTERLRAQQTLQNAYNELERRVQVRTSELVQLNDQLQLKIREKEHMEVMLRQKEAQLQLIIDSVPALISYVDAECRYRYVNRVYSDWFDKSREDIEGRNIREVLGEAAYLKIKPNTDKALAGTKADYELEVPYKNGGHRHVNAHYIPHIAADGQVLGFFVIVIDISERIQNLEKIHRLNQELEGRVKERTAQLEKANHKLETEICERKQIEADLKQEKSEQETLLDKLKAAQNQLLQSEKMASIGQLAAGVAHEINNPVGYVNSNINSLAKYVDSLFSLLTLYESAEEYLNNDNLNRQIQVLKKQIDLGYLKQDIVDLVKESQEGVTRVKQIVQDLKDFSHMDDGEWQWSDLHKGLDSTLNVVHNELKYKAEVVKEYGKLTDINCLSSQINQVFMNLLVNAAHAIESRGTITIRTRQADDDWVCVEITDTGKGISKAHLKRIFDPFFTTKPVGKGTGLGLSLAYGIVNKHGGRIEVDSDVGKGTSFRVWLPVNSKTTREDVELTECIIG